MIILNNTKIRYFKVEDIISVSALICEIFNEAYDEKMLLDYYYSWQEGFLVAEIEKNIIGTILGTMSTPTQARILIMGVKKEYRNQKIGTALLNSFILSAIAKNANLITLEVRISNPDGIKFYQRFGLEIVYRIPSYYKDGEDGYMMYKKI